MVQMSPTMHMQQQPSFVPPPLQYFSAAYTADMSNYL